MAGLQRSAVSFRRQGSSGFVWDDKFLTEEINKAAKEKEEQQQSQEEKEKGEIKELHISLPPLSLPSTSTTTTTTLERNRSNGGGRGHRTGKFTPAIEPPSPKISACGCCAAFGKAEDKGRHRAKQGKHRSR